MNLTKRRKITAIITLSFMLVAVVATACFLTIPGLYKGNDVTPAGTADNELKIENLTYNADNSGVVYGEMKDGSRVAYIAIQFPTKICLDVSESLDSVNYHYLIRTNYESSRGRSNSAVLFSNTIFGIYDSKHADHYSGLTNAHTMTDIFDYSVSNDKNANENVGGNDIGISNDSNSHNTVYKNNMVNNTSYSFSKWNLSGGIKTNSDGNKIYEDKVFDMPTNAHLAFLQYKPFIGDWTYTSNNGGPIDSFFDAGSSVQADSLSSFSGYTRKSTIQITINVYDKSNLKNSITNFKKKYNIIDSNINNTYEGKFIQGIIQNYYQEREVTQADVNNAIKYIQYYSSILDKAKEFESKINSNKGLLNAINGSDSAYNSASSFISSIKNTYLNKTASTGWAVTEAQANKAISDIDSYVFSISDITALNPTATYNGNAANLTSTWSRLNSAYYTLKVNGSTADTEIKNADNNQPKTYSLEVALATQVQGADGSTLKLQWGSSGDNSFKSIGSYTINPAPLKVSNLQKVEKDFKNSAYGINLSSASASGTLDGIISDYFSPTENPMNIYLVVDEAGKNPATGIDWTGVTAGNAVSIKDLGSHTVYYKITASNHTDVSGSFAVEIKAVTITLHFDVYSHTYGDTILTSEEIVDNMMKNNPKIFDAEDWNSIKNYLNQIFVFSVEVPSGFIDNAGYLIVRDGHYTVTYTRTGAFANEISNVVMVDNRGAYHVTPRPVKIEWTQQTNMYYDGMGGKRPSAKIVGDDNFVGNTSTGLKAPAISGPGQNSDDESVPLVGYEAINAGKYEAYVECINPNYQVDPVDPNSTCTFEILRRPITVELKNREREYAKELPAGQLWDRYTGDLFAENLNQAVYTATTAVSDGKGALIENGNKVFEIGLVGLYDDSIYTPYESEDEKYFKVNEAGYELTLTLINKNYILTDDSKGALFIVTPAEIDLDLQTIASKVYNATEQEIVMPNNNTVITLNGYEATHRDSVQILYSDTQYGTYSSTPLTIRDYGTKDVWYKVTADNHKENGGHFTVSMARTHIYIDVKGTASGTYGDELPTSKWLKENVGIEVSWSSDTNRFDYSNELEFTLLNASDRRARAGVYGITYRFTDAKYQDNYIVDYVSEGVNNGVYTINPKELYVEWKQTGDGWSENGLEYTYDGTSPKVKPFAPETLADGSENIVKVDPDNRDFIDLGELDFGPNVKDGGYQLTTSLSKSENLNNYVLKNATETFYIVKRVVNIHVKNQTADYGNAKNVAFATSMLSDTDPNTKWAYPSGVEESAKFVGHDYSAFRLVSEAHTPSQGQTYKDAGTYTVEIEAINNAVAINYQVNIVTEGAPDDRQAKFIIKPVDIHYTRRQFNIDFDNQDEKNFVTAEQIRGGISTAFGTDLGEFTISISDLIAQKKEDGTDNDVAITDPDVELVENGQTTEIDSTDVSKAKRYYVWVRITHLSAFGNSNYNKLEAKVEVNILSNWVSIVLGGQVEAEYGNPTFESEELFGKLNIVAIYGIEDSDPNAVLEQYVDDGKIEFFVGSGDTVTPMETNGSYGNYTVYIKVINDKLASGDFENFRFLDADHKSGTDKPTTNIDIYHVGQRVIGINWGTNGDGNMDEIYGEHSYTSPSHTYEVTNIMSVNGVQDDVRVTVKYERLVDGEWIELGDQEHATEVGEYRAKVVGVSHPNYKLPDDTVLQNTFNIEKREVTIVVTDRDLVYGLSDNAKRTGVEAFLNRQVAGLDRYTVAAGSKDFVSGESIASIFEFKIGNYQLADNLEYLTVGEYDILIQTLSANYDVRLKDNRAGVLHVKASASASFEGQQIPSKTFNGDNIQVAPSNIFANIKLAGDGAKLLEGLNPQDIVEYKLSTDDDSKYDANYKAVLLAGTYDVDIKISAPNHEEKVVTVKFTVERARVVIKINKVASKIYGDTEQDLGVTADYTFSDWLKDNCDIQINTYDERGNEIVVKDVDKDFIFKVIQKGQGNGDALVVGKNPIGTYRVYHQNHITLEATKYIIDYYQDPSLPEGDEYKCNAEAYRIDKRPVDVQWTWENAVDNDNHKFEYDNKAPVIKASVQLLGETDMTDLTLTYLSRGSYDDKQKAQDVNVGKYTAKVEVTSSFAYWAQLQNYDYSANDTFDYEIVAKEITVVIKNQFPIYGSNDTKVGEWNGHTEYDCDDDIYGQPIELSIDATTDKNYYEVGKYHIVGKNTSPNYKVTFKGADSDEEYAIFEVMPATLGVGVVQPSMRYNGKAYSVNVKNIVASGSDYTVAGDMTWDDAVVTYLQEDGTYSEVIPAIEGVTGSAGKKISYKVTLDNHNDYTGDITVVILRAKVTVNISRGGATTVYGEDLLSSDKLFEATNATLDIDNSTFDVDIKSILTLNVEINGNISANSGKVNAGTYSIDYTLLPECASLYEVELVGEESAYVVKQKELTLKWNYTDAIEYNGSEQIITATLEGVITGDNVAIGNYTGNRGTDAKSYTASAQGLNDSNYTLGSTSQLNWTIAPKSIEIDWIAGDFTYNKQSHALETPTIKDNQLIGSDNCAIVVEANDNVNAGTHTATAKTTNANYVVANDTFEYVIKPAPISINWNETTLTYNGKDQAPTAQVDENQLFGDDKCNVVVSGAQKNAGENYTATATLDNSNYTVADDGNASYKFAIAPKAITFTWENTDTLKYTGATQVPTAVANGAVEGDKVEFNVIVGEDKDGINVGEYVAIVTGVKDNGNYIIDDRNQTNMSTNYSIGKGTNEFIGLVAPDKNVSLLPWSGNDKPQSKWGEVVIKYYSDEACTQEITDINSAEEGTYWVKATVAGTDNYDEISQTFEVVLEGGFNVVIVVIGAIASLALLIGALVVVKLTNKKKHQGDVA